MTFLIPVRIDSIIRLENILSVIAYLRRNLQTHIMVLEASHYQNGILKQALPKGVEYYFVEDSDPIFYRTLYLNQMTRKVKTPFHAIWDADVIATPQQMQAALTQLQNGEADIAFPYDGSFLDASEIIRMQFVKNRRLSILTRNKAKMKQLYHSEMKGGGIFVNTQKYIEAGMENERFYGWGPEDFERYERWKGLGYRIYRSEGCLYHLSHPRDANGTHNSRQQMLIANNEVFIARNSSPEEIRQRVSHLQ